MKGFGTMILGFWLVFVFWLMIVLISQYDAHDVSSKCVGHVGVQQLVDTTFSAGRGAATVVCKDGTVWNIH